MGLREKVADRKPGRGFHQELAGWHLDVGHPSLSNGEEETVVEATLSIVACDKACEADT